METILRILPCGCTEETWQDKEEWDKVLAVNNRKKLGMDSADP